MPFPGQSAVKTYKFPYFTGGLSTNPSKPTECAQFDNFDVRRDGYSQTRQSTFLINTTTAIGTSMCVGLYRTSIASESNPAAMLIVAKTGTTFYSTPILGSYLNTATFSMPLNHLPLSFTSFTVPTSPGDSPVYFESMLDANFAPKVYMVNPNFGGVLLWDPSNPSGSASVISGSPANPYLIVEFSGRLFVVTTASPNVIQFSNPADPSTWSSTDKFQIASKWGPIVALMSQDDKLYIFTTTAILYMTGDPTAPYVGVMHPYITTVSQSTISQFGPLCMFAGRDNNIYSLAGSVNLTSDPIRGEMFGGTYLGNGANTTNAWGALTPFYYFLRAPLNTSSSPASPTKGSVTTFTMVYERERFGYWGRYVYPTNSGLGQSDPYQAIVCYIPEWQAVLLPNGIGDIYLQPLMNSNYPPNTQPAVPQDYGLTALTPVPVLSVLNTMMFEGEDDKFITKLFRRGMITGSGDLLGISLYLYTNSDTPTVIDPTIYRNSLPTQWELPGIDGSSSSASLEFNMIQIIISGTNLILRGMLYDYTLQRYNIIQPDQ